MEDFSFNLDETKHRIYDPWGRLGWWQIDPKADLDINVGWPPYNYAYANPIRYNDPNGDCPCNPLFNYGIGKGLVRGARGTWNFITEGVWKADTWKATGNLLLGAAASQGGNVGNLYALDAALGTNTVGATEGFSNAVDGAVNKLASGDPISQGEVVGEVLWGVAEGVVGSKGTGLIFKTGKASNTI